MYILSTFRNNLSNNTTQNRLLITSVKIDIFTKSLEVTVHNFEHFLSTILRFWALFEHFLAIFASTFLGFYERNRERPTYYESKTFSDSSSIAFSNPKMLGFIFSTKKSSTREVKCENYTSEIVGNLIDKLRELYLNGTVI